MTDEEQLKYAGGDSMAIREYQNETKNNKVKNNKTRKDRSKWRRKLNLSRQ